MSTDPAVTAAAEEPEVAAFEYAYDAVADLDNAVAERHYCYLPAVRAGLAAARPIIEAAKEVEVRERLAAEIERHAAEPETAPWRAFGAGLRTAARIARGQS